MPSRQKDSSEKWNLFKAIVYKNEIMSRFKSLKLYIPQMRPISWTILILLLILIVILVKSRLKKFNPEITKKTPIVKIEETKWKW